MLSEAKHLQYLLENTQMQILRFAQDDNPERLFPQPVKPRVVISTVWRQG